MGSGAGHGHGEGRREVVTGEAYSPTELSSVMAAA